MRSRLFVVGLCVLGTFVLAMRPGAQSSGPRRDPSPHQVRWVTVDSSVKLEVLDWGGSGPPLVLLACYLSTHVYDEFAPKLRDQFHVYGMTRRGIGASDKPATGYSVQQSANDLFDAFNALKLQQALLVGHSCAGQVLTLFAAQHGDRLRGLVYLDGATDPTLTNADVGAPMPAPGPRPSPVSPRPERGWDFPAAVDQEPLDPAIRKAITVDARMKPDYARVRVPVLAIYQGQPPFEEVAAGYVIRNDQERAVLRQEYAITRAFDTRWQQDLRAGVPTARIVELTGANLYMFLSNEADIIREVRAFAATLPPDAHAMDGRWVADLAASTLHAGTAVRRIALTFVVRSDRVRISDEVVAASGEQVGRGPAEFITDGQPHPNDALLPGLMAQARWTNPRRLETVLTRRSGVVERVSYEVSPDGLTLTNTTEGPLGRQIVVFRRP